MVTDPSQFTISLRGHRAVLEGDLDLYSMVQLMRVLDREGSPTELDMSGVNYIDSTAIAAIVGACRRDQRLRIVSPSQPLRRILEITGLDFLIRPAARSGPESATG